MNLRPGFFVAAAVALVVGFASGAQADGPGFDYETSIPGYYLGRGLDMAVDGQGNAYVVASWYEDEQHLDILVLKLDASGDPVWTVPIVGSAHDYASDIVLDDAGDVLITGWTDSEDFPQVNGMGAPTHARTAFVMKLSKDDGSILFSTLFGGDYTDAAAGIALNDAGEIYIVGSTGSTDFPTTADAYQDHPSAPLYIYTDAFITKFTPAADSILYSTYFGGYEDDQATQVSLDSEGNIVLAGRTSADDFPLVNPISAVPDGIFVSKMSADGSTLLFSTYLGGEDYDSFSAMALDAEGYVYLTGSTESIDFPTTPGAFQEELVGGINACGSPPFEPLHNCDDGFVTKLATDGSGLAFSTFLGGLSVDKCSNIAVGGEGCAHVVGSTTSSDFLGSGNAYASIFVAKLNPEGSGLVDIVTVQSPAAGSGHGIAVDAEQNVYFCGAVDIPYEIYVAKTAGWRQFTAVSEEVPTAAVHRLGSGIPNPFSQATTIGYDLPEPAAVTLRIFDVSGRLVTLLKNGSEESAGRHEVTWTGRDLKGREVPPGMYFCRLEAGNYTETRRIVLIR